MKIFESIHIQSAMFEHGEPLLIVSKRELISLLYDLRHCCQRNHPRLPDVDQVLALDNFTFRGSDLPETPFNDWGDDYEQG